MSEMFLWFSDKDADKIRTDAEFERASNKPAFVHVLRYATYERLKEWGVPIDTAVARKAPNPFPASMAAVPAPPGWNG